MASPANHPIPLREKNSLPKAKLIRNVTKARVKDVGTFTKKQKHLPSSMASWKKRLPAQNR